MIRFLPPDEHEIRQSIAEELRKRASESCYWKEDYLFRAKNADLTELQNKYLQEAELYRLSEAIWNEAVDIALEKRREINRGLDKN